MTLSLSIIGGMLASLPVLVSLFSMVNFFLDGTSGLDKIFLRPLKYVCFDFRAVYSKSFFFSLYFSKSFFILSLSVVVWILFLLIESMAFEYTLKALFFLVSFLLVVLSSQGLSFSWIVTDLCGT